MQTESNTGVMVADRARVCVLFKTEKKHTLPIYNVTVLSCTMLDEVELGVVIHKSVLACLRTD